MNDLIILKTNLIGGVEKQQVINYITEMQAQLKEQDLTPEINAAQIKIRILNEEISNRESTLNDLQIKFEQLNSFEARLEAALNFIRAIPEKHFKSIFKNEQARNFFDKLNHLLSANTGSADSVLHKINAVNAEIKKISDDLQSVLLKLEKLSFDEDTEISVPSCTNTDSPAEINEMPIADGINTTDEFFEAENIDIQPEILQEAEDAPEAYVLLEDEAEDSEPMFENSVDNFFAELEKLMNK